METGIFVSFEGSEGCGKSTQINLLRQLIESAGRRCEVTREPGGTKLGEVIRHLLKHAPEGDGMTPESELLLFAASRAQLVREKIQPWLEAGVSVIADRFLDSTVVYQGIARGLDLDAVRSINAFAVGSCLPDLTFVLDMDAGNAFERAAARSEKPDRMESEALSFYEKVRQGYLDLAAAEPDRFVVLDAGASIETIAEQIESTLTNRYNGFPR
ncbi:MAG: dTMP kinase [Verrucomicrobiales bacterium]|jgi:dTMP kinase